MITYCEILMNRDIQAPLTEEQWRNLCDLLPRINFVRFHYGKPMRVTSGYRPAAQNASAGGAKRSAHLSCQAVDLADPDGALKAWCLANFHVIEQAGLYMEEPAATPTWLHLQSRKTNSNPFKP